MGKVEVPAKMEGYRMIMVLAPTGKALKEATAAEEKKEKKKGGKRKGKGKARKVAEPKLAYSTEFANLSPAALARKLKQLEAKMHEHAKNLEFEEAAALRDQLAEIKQAAFIS